MASGDKLAHQFYGGQALIEGVMIRTRSGVAIAVRQPNDEIAKATLPLSRITQNRWSKVVGVRGILILVDSIVMGMRALSLSARLSQNDEDVSEDENQQSEIGEKVVLGGMVTLGLLIGIALFLIVPNLAIIWIDTENVPTIIPNLVEGVIRIAIFILYIWGIGFLKDVKRTYGYHGAEHKTIAAAEQGGDLTLEKVKLYRKEHPRCGTAFLITVALVTLVVFLFLPREPLWLLLLTRVLVIPVVMGLSYEMIRLASLYPHSFFARILNFPNILAQKLTTREPEDGMIEVALVAMQVAKQISGRADLSVSPSGAEASATDL